MTTYADPNTYHYIETLRLIQKLAMADVPRCFRTKPWSDEKLAPIAEMLAAGARMGHCGCCAHNRRAA